MTSLSFPDVNVWLALLVSDHVHHRVAISWWNQDQSEQIAFCRFTQLGLLRLMTTAAAMDGAPLTMDEAWRAYDDVFEDERVVLVSEPPGCEMAFRKYAKRQTASPKLWADSYLLAFATVSQGTIVTFDRAFPGKGVACRLLEGA
jgi:toxin-antitoxin system PIN domain toxin